MIPNLDALDASVTALAELVDTLDDTALTEPAYPSAWTVADTLSHLGSGAEIMGGMLAAAVADEVVPDGRSQQIWDRWNAKSPIDQARDLPGPDRAFVDAVGDLDEGTVAHLRIPMGDTRIDVAELVQHRLDEHVVHSWDVRVAFDATRTLPAEMVPHLVDHLGPAAQLSGRPVDDERTVVVHTFEPGRSFRLELGPDAVILESDVRPDRTLEELHLPAEALVRLVYGRLDPDHTPSGVGGSADLDELRSIFVGF